MCGNAEFLDVSACDAYTNDGNADNNQAACGKLPDAVHRLLPMRYLRPKY